MSELSAGGERRAAAELVAARLRLVLEAAQLGLWDWDIESGLVEWDERSLAMFGRTSATMPSRLDDLQAVIHPEDIGGVVLALEQARVTAGAVDLEYRVTWPDGQERWLNGRGQAIVDDGGRVTRVLGTNADVTALRSAALQQIDDVRRMAGLVAVAEDLGSAGSESEVLDVVTGLGLRLLGARAAVLCVLDEGSAGVRAWTVGIGDAVQAQVEHLPAGFPLPMVDAAVTGTAHFLDDRAAATALFPDGAALFEQVGAQGMAAVPMWAEGRLLGSLSVGWRDPRAWRDPDRELFVALATLTAQTLDRIWARRAERRLSETLQRTLLTSAPQPDHLQIAMRYQPAAHEAQVGGDWYDAFIGAGGVTTLVVGDVAGHDQDAAAAMAQVRNVLRGVAQTLPGSPAAVLSALDRALEALAVPALATAVLCQVVEHPDDRGRRRLEWSNAGHPPPLLVRSAAEAEVLTSDPDLLLGLEPASARCDHHVDLPDDATLVLYTDGLVERRGEALGEGIERLRLAVQHHASTPVERLAAQLLDELAHDAEDDVALLILRAASRAGGPGPLTPAPRFVGSSARSRHGARYRAPQAGRRMGERVRVVMSPASGGENPYVDGVVAQLRARGWQVEDFTRRAALTRPDVVHVHWPEFLVRWDAPGPVAALDVAKVLGVLALARLRGTRLVWTAHNLQPHALTRPALWRVFFRGFAQQVDLVLTLSDAAGEAVRQRHPVLRRTPWRRTPHGDYRAAHPRVDQAAARRQLGWPAAPTLLLFGQVRRYKNALGVVTAFVQLPANPSSDGASDERLVVAGQPREPGVREDLERAAGDDPRVRLELRAVDHEEVAAVISASDVVVLPYLEASALNSGVALLALSLARPVVMTASATADELAAAVGPGWVHGCDGTPGDALRVARAAVRGDVRAASGDEPDLAQFTWDHVGELTDAALREVVARTT